MNEKIKQLAIEAGMDPWGVGNGDNVSDIIEKFAHLLIIECCELASDTGDSEGDGWGQYIAKTIRDQFGVTEE